MEQSKHLSASSVGLILLPLSALSIVVARVVSGRGWVRWPLILAGVSLILAAGVMLRTTHESSVALLIVLSLLLGFTNGCSGFGNQATLYLQSPADDIAVASGLLRTATYMGAIFSSSLIGIAFGSATTDGGLHAIAWVFGGIGLVVVLLTTLDRSIPRVAE
jgi:MFS family permease